MENGRLANLSWTKNATFVIRDRTHPNISTRVSYILLFPDSVNCVLCFYDSAHHCMYVLRHNRFSLVISVYASSIPMQTSSAFGFNDIHLLNFTLAFDTY